MNTIVFCRSWNIKGMKSSHLTKTKIKISLAQVIIYNI